MDIFARLVKRITFKIADTDFVKRAMAEKSDLSAFREKPGGTVLVGLALLAFSYVIGWPAVAAFGAVAIYLEKPAIVLVGGPLIYAFSHLVFMVGIYFCGNRYPLIFLRWLARVSMEKMLAMVGPDLDRQ